MRERVEVEVWMGIGVNVVCVVRGCRGQTMPDTYGVVKRGEEVQQVRRREVRPGPGDGWLSARFAGELCRTPTWPGIRGAAGCGILEVDHTPDGGRLVKKERKG